MKKSFCLAMVLMSWSPAYADILTGKELLELSNSALQWYVAGVIEGHREGRAGASAALIRSVPDIETEALFAVSRGDIDIGCSTDKSWNQITAVVTKYIKANPEIWDQSRVNVVLNAVNSWCEGEARAN